jgi:tetratricopeptide (TPR) repeat protein
MTLSPPKAKSAGLRARHAENKETTTFILPTETDRAARRSLARLAKRQGDLELACELWQNATGNSRHGYEAYEQLAIYYEHKARDPEQARQIVRRAIDELRRANQAGDLTPGAHRQIRARFDRRLVRLDGKIRTPLLNAIAVSAQA